MASGFSLLDNNIRHAMWNADAQEKALLEGVRHRDRGAALVLSDYYEEHGIPLLLHVWLAKHERTKSPWGTEDYGGGPSRPWGGRGDPESDAVHVFTDGLDRDALRDLSHLLDYVVSSHVSGPAAVLVPSYEWAALVAPPKPAAKPKRHR